MKLTTLIAFITAPPEPFIPASLQGTHMMALAMCYCGSAEDGEELLRPIRNFKTPAVDMAGTFTLY